MATIAYPTADLYRPSSIEWGETRIVRVTGGTPLGPAEQTIETPYSHRWRATLTLRRRAVPAQRAQVEAWISTLRSGANRLTLHHIAHPAPYGTLRGSPTLSGAHAQGATTLLVAGTNGQTLIAGDMLGVTTSAGAQLVRVVTGGTVASGTVSVAIEPALRAGASSGSAVVWDKPTALFRLAAPDWSAQFVPGEAPPITLEFVEVTA
jgi:hypothetical protein